jgi:transcriptional regulator with AAA-type ATPase domain
MAEGLHVLVMGPEAFASHRLPAAGEVTIGRGRGADVPLTDPLASRRHAVLRIGTELIIEDLASANGTRLRDQSLPRGEATRLVPGEAIAIGSTILMVLPNQPDPLRRWLSDDEFEACATWECRRALASAGSFALLRLLVGGRPDVNAVAAALEDVLRPMDLVTTYAPAHFDLLLPGFDAAAGATMGSALVQALRRSGQHARLAQASFPQDGVHIAALRAALTQDFAPPSHEKAETTIEPDDPAMRAVYALAERAAASDVSVLILGEAGVGKEVLARRIHVLSARSRKPFVRVNSAALSQSLLESELFGHERGVFAGAGSAKPGLLETSPGGTVFLDGIADLAPPLQTKLLAVIENRETTRIGGLLPQAIDVRFLTATHRDLEVAVRAGRFRRDLYLRLSGMTLPVPPLRERTGDIRRLAQAFVAAARPSPRGKPVALSSGALALLRAYTWPGNVRELRNAMERAVLVAPGRQIAEEHLPATVRRGEALLARLRASRVARPKQRRPR